MQKIKKCPKLNNKLDCENRFGCNWTKNGKCIAEPQSRSLEEKERLIKDTTCTQFNGNPEHCRFQCSYRPKNNLCVFNRGAKLKKHGFPSRQDDRRDAVFFRKLIANNGELLISYIDLMNNVNDDYFRKISSNIPLELKRILSCGKHEEIVLEMKKISNKFPIVGSRTEITDNSSDADNVFDFDDDGENFND